MDGRGGHQPPGSGAGDRGFVVRAVRVPAGGFTDDEGGFGAAQPVRRARGAADQRVRGSEVYVRHLGLRDFRSWEQVDLDLEPGRTVFVGPNGYGKTNLVEALWYSATLGSHRVASDAPLIRDGAPRAVVSTIVVNEGRELAVDLEITAGRANKARLNRSPSERRARCWECCGRCCSRPKTWRWCVVIPGNAGAISMSWPPRVVPGSPPSGGLRQGVAAAHRAAEDRGRARVIAATAGPWTPWTCGTGTWPRTARS